ncbi:HugZ family heme oxygenase [Helicobacter muridarum]|uniref:HugZ family heme oxygenase n=1 Tax=Helicobacter muridarum TaxID=216 RepID=A0A099U1Q6_9HELI|nr:HugZ family heme oxygenase [Helicobacter muridarum]TLE00785.1 HugZ family heme oxygenase [Helicobacter muridarum]STQ86531.1 putative heme iron utilization protein [Helicobacter muridarum]
MSVESIKEHMNSHHIEELKGLVKLYGGFDANQVNLINVNSTGLTIQADSKEIFAPFPTKTEEKDYKNAIIALCSAISKKPDNIKQEIAEFIESFNTILLSTISPSNFPNISYSPLLRYDNNYFIYISEIAEHYTNLKNNPKLQVMFIEDEAKTKTILARKRLIYDTQAEFMPRDSFFDKVYDAFEQRMGGKSGGIGTVREMNDFHLVKLSFKNGRYVKGFGQAYKIAEDGEVSHMGGGKGGMPHAMPHKK